MDSRIVYPFIQPYQRMIYYSYCKPVRKRFHKNLFPCTVKTMTGICPFCNVNPRPSKKRSYCDMCHALYQMLYRKRHRDMSPEARRRARCRAHANVYRRRGKLIPGPCYVCGTMKKIEMQHDDYSKPLQVKWICKKHNIARRAGRLASPELAALCRRMGERLEAKHAPTTNPTSPEPEPHYQS